AAAGGKGLAPVRAERHEVGHLLALQVDHAQHVAPAHPEGNAGLGLDTPEPDLLLHDCSSVSKWTGQRQRGPTRRPAYCRASLWAPKSASMALGEPWRCSSRSRILPFSRSKRDSSRRRSNWAWSLNTRVGQGKRRAQRSLDGASPTTKKAWPPKLKANRGSEGSLLKLSAQS